MNSAPVLFVLYSICLCASPHYYIQYACSSQKTREEWPLLTVATEVNGDSNSTNERGPSLVGSLGRSAGNRDFYPALAALVSPVQEKFSSPYTISIYVSPSHSHLAGRRAESPVSDFVVSGSGIQ